LRGRVPVGRKNERSKVGRTRPERPTPVENERGMCHMYARGAKGHPECRLLRRRSGSAANDASSDSRSGIGKRRTALDQFAIDFHHATLDGSVWMGTVCRWVMFRVGAISTAFADLEECIALTRAICAFLQDVQRKPLQLPVGVTSDAVAASIDDHV
jgi:hypothetical protein